MINRNNGYILLSGGGDLNDTIELDKKFFSLLKNDSKILYIPIAMDNSSLGFESCYDWFSSLISYYTQAKDIDFTMHLEGDKIPDFGKYDAIYTGGGNTFKLLNYLIKNKLNQKMIEYLNLGGILYGGSAGAIILGKDIRTVAEENDKNYQYFEGLNLIDNYSIICHYNNEMDNKIMQLSSKYNLRIIALPENSGITFHNRGIEIVGEIFIFDKETKTSYSNRVYKL